MAPAGKFGPDSSDRLFYFADSIGSMFGFLICSFYAWDPPLLLALIPQA